MKKLKITLADAPAKGLEQIPINKKEVIMNPVEEPKKPVIEIGIEETKQVVSFGTALANALIQAFKDGKLNFTDLPLLMSPFMKLFPAISGINNVPSEIDNLSETELAELKKQVTEELELSDIKAELIIQMSLTLIHDMYALYKVATN